eukprot:TRINITY_DN14557_c0_g1_i2.p1 TRINITY_DN14557_c0_g1~~TRINITY_DN14557_c0_g1_i2.p1  ORF type:complete len:106 (-),score=20.84 TRINITY_DN14557_c0_g1_i2:81-398(-)
MAMRSRSILAVAAVLALLAFVASRTAFVAPASATADKQQLTVQQDAQSTAVLGASAGFLAAAPQPAHALLLQDEILPISFAVIGATLWGIVLGFVLLRLQEAFPE